MSKDDQILKNTNAKLLNQFNASLMFDKKLYSQDIQGSIAHAKMLCMQNIITNDEQQKIENGLLQIKDEIQTDKFKWNIQDEDIHMAIEARLTKLIGDTAGKLHTARSRNDQVATDMAMYLQDKNNSISNKLKDIITTFVKLADKHIDTLMPGLTHLQHAQPINFAYHLLAYVQMFKRDYDRFQSSKNRNNLCPLGSCALAGTSHNIDRDKTAQLLGFNAPTSSALDTSSNRDMALEMLFNISMTSMHISRLSEELIMWSSSEFGFVTISDEYATTSSIMPQKKNPDVPELLRGKTGRVYGNLISLLVVMKSLPLAYNKDTQEDKEGVFDSIDTIEMSLDILNDMIKNITINNNNMQNACKVGHISATDLADYLVKKHNIPFRIAYHTTKEVVKYAKKINKDISALTIDELKASSSQLKDINDEVLECLDLKNSMNSRDSYGGTSENQTKNQINEIKKWLTETK
ncbi:MAG: argininosuccinate lyase [Epsilonproteobacteria bacterium]|nr:MAG: argininosuccinate lyase [Campylobacterota bacterium]